MSSRADEIPGTGDVVSVAISTPESAELMRIAEFWLRV